MTNSDPSETIRHFILERFLFSDDPADLPEFASLVGEGILDSMGALELITFLEEEFGITIKDEEALPENLDSVACISDFVARKRALAHGTSGAEVQAP